MQHLWAKLKSHPGLLLVLAASIASHLVWFFGGGYITYGDAGVWLLDTVKEFISNSGHIYTATQGMGSLSLTASYNPVLFLYGLLGHLGLGYDASLRVLLLWPFVLGAPLAAYGLSYKFLQSKMAATISSLVILFNTYTLLLQGGHLLILAGDALLIASLYFAFKYFEESKSRANFVKLFFALVAASFFEFRIFYIGTGVISLFLLYRWVVLRKPIKDFIPWALILAFVGLVNSFWLLAVSKGGSFSGNAVFSSELFGGQFFSPSSALTLFHQFWTGGKTAVFISQPIPLYFWLIPILVLAGLAVSWRKEKYASFFAALAIIGIFLTKQSAEPFSGVYQWLFNHFPGFNAFREASKFYILTVISYALLIGYFVKWLYVKRNSKKWLVWCRPVIIGVLSVIFLWNTRPLVTGEFGTLFTPRQIPADYIKLNKFLEDKGEYWRTFWVPTGSRWAVYGNDHPQLRAASEVFGNWSRFKDEKTASWVIAQQITELLKSQHGPDLMNRTATRYIIVPMRDIQNDDDMFKGYGDDRQFYLDLLDRTPWLTKLDIGTSEVAIYENKDYKPYISAITGISKLHSLDDLDQKYNFVTGALKSDFTFSGSENTSPGTAVRDIFEGLKRENISPQGSLEVGASSGAIYANANLPNLSYQVTNNNLLIAQRLSAGLKVDGQPLGPQIAQSKPIAQIALRPGAEFLLGLGKELVPLKTPTSEVRNLGKSSTGLVVYGESSTNRIVDPKLTNGLWRERVEDCNAYDENAIIGMSLVNDEDRASQVLELTAGKHTACTGPEPVAVRPSEQLAVQFDYRVKQGKEAGYELVYNDASHTVERIYLPVTDGGWRTLRRVATVPPGASTVRIRLKAFPNEQKSKLGLTRYDNIRLSGIIEMMRPNLNLAPQYAQTEAPSVAGKITLSELGITGQNLVPNPSVESKLWSDKVGDCNAHDDNPSLGMRLTDKEKTDGRQSLELSAKRHIGCTGPDKIKIKEGAAYHLSFDYQSPNGKIAGYSLAFSDEGRTSVSDNGLRPTKSWQTLDKTFIAPYGATEATLTVYGYSEEPSNKTIINRYDNFRLVEIPNVQNQYYLVDRPAQQLQVPGKVDFTLVNPTKKLVHIKDAKTPFYLSMSEAYHPQWRLELNNGQVKGINSWVPWAKPQAVADADHFKLNDFLNGWYVDPAKLCAQGRAGCVQHADGSYDLELAAEFTPQRWFYVGSIISGLTLAGCLTYLVWGWRRRKRNAREADEK